MKVKIAEVRPVKDSVYVKGIRTRKVNNQFIDEVVNIRFSKENWHKPEKIILPWVIDVSFIKGKGAILNG